MLKKWEVSVEKWEVSVEKWEVSVEYEGKPSTVVLLLYETSGSIPQHAGHKKVSHS